MSRPVRNKILAVALLAAFFVGGYVYRGCTIPTGDELVASLQEKVAAANATIERTEAENKELLNKNEELSGKVRETEAAVESTATKISTLTTKIEELKKTATTIAEKDEIIAAQDERFSLAMIEVASLKVIIGLENTRYTNLNIAYINRGIALDETRKAMSDGLITSQKLASENKKLKGLLKIGGYGVVGYATWKLVAQPLLR